MFVWHNDEVYANHPDLNIIAYSEDCPNHIFRYKDKLIWGIQGHPEITVEESKIWFEENRSDLENDGAIIETLINEADEAKPAKIMIERFAKLI
jgi:GMP synthase (glutamine-hydrolysing)